MKVTSEISIENLAVIVTKVLAKHKISAVLTGGAVVSIYTHNEYTSRDLDFISAADQNKIAAAMEEIDFHRHGRSFKSKNTRLTVEFPTGPLAIGDREYVEAEAEIKIKGTIVKLLSPTQCVMDRLAWFYDHNDRQCLDQAVQVALHQPVKLNEIKKWSIEESSLKKYETFMDALRYKKEME